MPTLIDSDIDALCPGNRRRARVAQTLRNQFEQSIGSTYRAGELVNLAAAVLLAVDEDTNDHEMVATTMTRAIAREFPAATGHQGPTRDEQLRAWALAAANTHLGPDPERPNPNHLLRHAARIEAYLRDGNTQEANT